MWYFLVNNYLLVVDDNLGIRLLFHEFLSQEGFYVKEASNGLEALQLVMEEKPRLILLDMIMPGLGGMEIIVKLKHLAPETIVVAMSAYIDVKDITDAIQDGLIEHYITKPFDLDKVRILLNSLLSTPSEKRVGQSI